MALDVTNWNPEVADIYLKFGSRRMPLVRKQTTGEKMERLATRPAQELFPQAASAEALLAGLLLITGDWEAAHEAAQNIDAREGSYWHAIVHRMEPDPWNSAYWFRRVGKHPIFPELAAEAERLLAQQAITEFTVKDVWDPSAFIDWCEQAAAQGSAAERAAIEVQHAEWRLLMEWCNQPLSSSLKLLRT